MCSDDGTSLLVDAKRISVMFGALFHSLFLQRRCFSLVHGIAGIIGSVVNIS